MKVYHDLLNDILKNGVVEKNERTGTGTKKVFGRMVRFDLSQGFPLLTTKQMYLKAIIHELLWFIKGDTNLRYLAKNNVRIWNEWPFQNYLKANKLDKRYPMYSSTWQEKMIEYVEKIKSDKKFAEKWGNLGPVYGAQWRNFDGFDQLKWVVREIKNNPGSRRLIVNAWNASRVDTMALPPCHVMYQFSVSNNKLSCLMTQRSVDTFLGLPFNIASYALLTMMIAHVTNLKPGELVLSLADTHIYLNHIDQAKEIVKRKPYTLPTMKLNKDVKSLFRFKYEDFTLMNYQYHPPIKAKISV
ncbi:thymidylate synthase [Candidatus Woesebacteria bacterium]|nr:MAG: thymidylate synthase [Candidatus Woesebacteria bacterium]